MYLYWGREGEWAWLLHRVSGLAVVLFLFIHILDTALIGLGANVYNDVMMLYRVPAFRVGEVLLAGAVIYHAFNGIRVMLVDFWSGATKVERQMWWAVAVLFVITWLPAAYWMLKPVFFK